MRINKTRLIAAAAVLGFNAVTGLYNTVQVNTLKAAVEATGTTIVEKECEQAEDTVTFGWYEVEWKGDKLVTDERVICTDAAKGDEYVATLKHEATHVAQACTGWDTVLPEGTKQLTRELSSRHDVDELLATYEEEEHAIELEAFYMETKTVDEVTQLVRKWCA